jgi:arsenate reductase
MTRALILHNPRCSKSRATLELLRAQGVEPEVRPYLEVPLDTTELACIVRALGVPARAIVRTEEAAWRALKLDLDSADEARVLAAIAAQPVLLQRPIVLVGGRAAIGRPPENVLALL